MDGGAAAAPTIFDCRVIDFSAPPFIHHGRSKNCAGTVPAAVKEGPGGGGDWNRRIFLLFVPLRTDVSTLAAGVIESVHLNLKRITRCRDRSADCNVGTFDAKVDLFIR